MATNRLEASGGGAEARTGGAPEAGSAGAVAPAGAPAGGGLKGWLPLIITLVAMPLLAYATTTFVLLPKLQRSMGAPAAAPNEPAAAPEKGRGESRADSRGAAAEGKASAGAPGKSKVYAQLNKVLVNVAGTMGTRFLVVNLTLVGRKGGLDGDVKESEPELRHVTIGCLSGKTINDLERPGAKNIIRSELISLYNSVLGAGAVDEIFFTEFAIQ